MKFLCYNDLQNVLHAFLRISFYILVKLQLHSVGMHVPHIHQLPPLVYT
jgi:hypothetical protein